MFTPPDVDSFLSQRISQDPLENFFGCQRQRGGTHDNPNLQEFQKNMQALRVVNSFAKGPKAGNCTGSKDVDKDLLQENDPTKTIVSCKEMVHNGKTTDYLLKV